jgi:hypothetical protein
MWIWTTPTFCSRAAVISAEFDEPALGLGCDVMKYTKPIMIKTGSMKDKTIKVRNCLGVLTGPLWSSS